MFEFCLLLELQVAMFEFCLLLDFIIINNTNMYRLVSHLSQRGGPCGGMCGDLRKARACATRTTCMHRTQAEM